MRVSLLIIGAATVLATAGCENQQAEFANRAELDELIPEAQEHVRGVLTGDEDHAGHFGTPTNAIAWERLPVHFHGATGSFVENAADESGEISKLKVNISEQVRPIEEGQELAWVSGKYVGQESPHVVSFDEETSTVEIDRPLSEPPDAGDRFAIAPGIVLQHGRMLYAEHCQHCHGVSGDGDGPTAKYLNPKPRDYRLGKFKFTSTQTPDKASRHDLAQIIENGIPGTYMPSFKLLTPEESLAIVEYVRWLAMRGETEYRLIQALRNDYSETAVESSVASARESDENLSAGEARKQIVGDLEEYLSGDWPEEFNEDTKFQAEQWRNAEGEEAIVLPELARVPDTPESRARGRELYLSAQAKCATCHGDAGHGDGPQTLAVQKNPMTNEDYDVPGLFDDWGNPLQPRDLTQGIYRGGRRPVDLYRRIHSGIKGTPMPAFGTVLKDEDIWHLVNYVMNLPFEAREQRPGDGASEARPEPAEVAATERGGELQTAN